MLAARANDELSEAERAKLDDHCESCLTCQALELRSRRAERAFAAIMRMPVAAGAVAGREATVVTPEAAIAPGAEAAIAPEAEAAIAPESEAAIAPESEAAIAPEAEAQAAPEPRSPGASAWLPAALASAEPHSKPDGLTAPATGLGAGEAALREVGTVSTPVAEPGPSRRRRRSVIFGAAAAVAAAAIAAAVLLTNASNNGHQASRTNIAARSTATTPVRHRAVNRAATAQKHQAAAQHSSHAVAAAAPSAPAASAPVSSTQSSQSAGSSSAPARAPRHLPRLRRRQLQAQPRPAHRRRPQALSHPLRHRSRFSSRHLAQRTRLRASASRRIETGTRRSRPPTRQWSLLYPSEARSSRSAARGPMGATLSDSQPLRRCRGREHEDSRGDLRCAA